MIYVLCPYGMVSGGPDALHQIVFYLNKININAKIVYFGVNKYRLSVPTQYSPYIEDYLLLSDIEDSSKNSIVVPEAYLSYSSRFKQVNIYIWWLSVNNNFSNTSLLSKLKKILLFPISMIKNHKDLRNYLDKFNSDITKVKYSFKSEDLRVKHLCASYYALDYISQRSKNEIFKCIEPISLGFLKNSLNQTKTKRTNNILYNPVKSGKFIELIKHKDKNLSFIPLQGMSQAELIEKYQTSKLYVDFGPFPGAERMPKEAVLNGCAIITGKFGASNYYGDVPIPDVYKFDAKKKNVGLIINKIKFCLDNYEGIIDDFSIYKKTVLALELNFMKSLGGIFNGK